MLIRITMVSAATNGGDDHGDADLAGPPRLNPLDGTLPASMHTTTNMCGKEPKGSPEHLSDRCSDLNTIIFKSTSVAEAGSS